MYMMSENFIINIVLYLKEHWSDLLLKTALTITVFVLGYIGSKRIVNKIKKRIE